MYHFSARKFSPEIYTVYRSDRDCHNKLRGTGDLIAVSEAVFGAKRRSDFEYTRILRSVWVEITVTDGHNLLIGNHYFAPDMKDDIIKIFA
jgi:hypothetical protein